jgi:hypothetical protein
MRIEPAVEQMISSLLQQIVYGMAHLRTAKGLAKSDPVALNAAHTFFGMTIDSHVYSAQMHAARLHDDTHGALTIQTLLTRVQKEAGNAKYGSASEVRTSVDAAEKALTALAAPLKRTSVG